MPWNQVLSSPAGAVLGLIAVVSVISLALTVKQLLERKSAERNQEEAFRDQVIRSIALIERERIPLPDNWLDKINERIDHKNRSQRMQFGILALLIRRGHHDEAASLLESMEKDL